MPALSRRDKASTYRLIRLGLREYRESARASLLLIVSCADSSSRRYSARSSNRHSKKPSRPSNLATKLCQSMERPRATAARWSTLKRPISVTSASRRAVRASGTWGGFRQCKAMFSLNEARSAVLLRSLFCSMHHLHSYAISGERWFKQAYRMAASFWPFSIFNLEPFRRDACDVGAQPPFEFRLSHVLWCGIAKFQ